MTGSGAALTCVMIFFDGERFIDEAIASVVGQQGVEDWELLVVDDGSSDGSTAIARRWAETDERIRYLEHDGHQNRGMSATRNLGLANARGEYVTFLDCDDVWLPHKLATQLPRLQQDPSLDATYARTVWWHRWSGRGEDRAFERTNEIGCEPGTVFEPPELLRHFRRHDGATVPAICSVVMRTAALRAAGGFEEDFRGAYEDQVFYAKLGTTMRVLVTDEILELYRQHPGSHCAQGIAGGTYHLELLSAAEARYLVWLEAYLRRRDLVGDEAWQDTQRALAPYRQRLHPTMATNQRWRADVAARVKLAAQRIAPEIYEKLRTSLREDELDPAIDEAVARHEAAVAGT